MKQIFLALSIVLLASCGGGSDNPTQTITITGNVTFEDVDNWNDNENIFVGLFSDNNYTPVYKTQISKPVGSSATNFTLSNVKSGIYTCKVYAASANGTAKGTIYTFSASTFEEDQQLTKTGIKLVTFTRVQYQVLNSCIQCHGGSNLAEANLYLTPDKSYNALVNVSSQMEGHKSEILVKPDDAAKSFITKVLNQSGINFEHTQSASVPANDKKLIENWINNGAKND